MNKRKLGFGLALVLLVGILVFPVTGATLEVPGTYDTITEALKAASANDTINVAETYSFSGEEFPILIQKDGITINGNEAVFDSNTGNKALFTVGAKRYVDPDTGEKKYDRVSGVTIKNFVVEGFTPVAFVVKHADNVTLEGNTIDAFLAGAPQRQIREGIRLIDTDNSIIESNTITEVGGKSTDREGNLTNADGIGIFLQKSDNNLLTGNIVERSGLGLFLYKSKDNEVDGDLYESNFFGGVVVNNSNSNLLTGLTVANNGDSNDSAWGVRFVHSDMNTLKGSEVVANSEGGIQLLGAQDNNIDGNLVYDNGTSESSDDNDAQIVITKGDKLEVEAERNLEYTWEDFVQQKHLVEDKILLLDDWLTKLDDELEDLPKIIGDGHLEEAKARLRAILAGLGDEQTGNYYGKIYGPFDPQTASNKYQNEADEKVILDQSHLTDPDQNFTLEENISGSSTDFEKLADDLDRYTDDGDGPWSGANFGLGGSISSSYYSWDKLSIIDILIDAARNEIYDGDVDWEGEDRTSLMDMLDYFHNNGLIEDEDYRELGKKLIGVDPNENQNPEPYGAAGFMDSIEELKKGTEGRPGIVDYIDRLYQRIEDDGNAAEAYARTVKKEVHDLKVEMRDYMDDVLTDLCRADIEMTPLPGLNTKLVGKKEKPFYLIDGEESEKVDPGSLTVGEEFDYGTSFTLSDRVRESTGNVIESNTITTDLQNVAANVGIVIESPFNEVVNNLISNEGGVLPGEETDYSEVHRLDFAMYLLSNENLIAHNAIEFVDHGIIRGGSWDRDDYQLEYVAKGYPLVADWPYPEYYVEDDCGSHTAGDFVERNIDWIPVFGLQQDDVVVKYEEEVTVKRNDLVRNFFDHAGTGIEIKYAESNTIKSNLFYQVASGNLIFSEYASSGIQLGENDHYGGFAIINNSNYAVSAGEDYTPPEGEPGHAKTDSSGKRVTPPANDAPHSESSFQNEEAESWYDDHGLGYLFNQKLPPNMDYIYDGVTLPDEKPRYAGEVFDSIPIPDDDNGGPVDETCFSVSGLWNLVSMPVAPSDDDPNAVFDEVPGTLYLWEYPDGSGWNTVEGGTLDSVDVYGGYYLWLPSDTSVTQICTAGSAVTGDDSINLGNAGWRLFGVPYEVNLVDDGDPDTGYVYLSDGNDEYYLSEAFNEGWLGDDRIWEYNANTQSFETATVGQDKVLEPDRGYWIYTGQSNLTLHFSTTEPSDGDGPGPPPTPETAAVTLNETGAEIESSPPVPVEPAGDFSVDALEVKAVSQAETVTFQVSGDGAAFVGGVKVEVFDAGGRKIASLESGGNSVQWSTSDVANGVYLYAASVNANGTYTQTNIDKLLLLK